MLKYLVQYFAPLYLGTLLALSALVFGDVHESLEALPRGWHKASSQLAEDQLVELHIALQYNNIDSLENQLLAVSDPTSSVYGHYLELSQLNAIFAPSKAREKRVTTWLESHDSFHVSSRDGYTISFITPVSEANRILNASFGMFTNGEITKFGTLAYSVPDELQEDIDIITPTTYFGYPKKVSPTLYHPTNPEHASIEKRSNLRRCHDVRNVTLGPYTFPYTFVTSGCYPDLYNIGDYSSSAKSGSSVAFPSFLGQVANYEDLATFERDYKIPDRNFSVLGLINGAHDTQDVPFQDRDEANLDSQTIISLVGELPVGEYIQRGKAAGFIPTLQYKRSDNEPFLEFFQYLLSQPSKNLPQVISNSYADDEVNVPKKYAVRACRMIAMLGLRGITVLAPSGDSGPGDVCLSANGTEQFIPMFPSGCPWVTVVGGTQHTSPVRASVNSGGGFSNYFATPSYQKGAVSTYLDQYINREAREYYSSNGYVDFHGRGIPDISANFGPPQFPVIINGSLAPGGGTSEAVPIVASIIALLNDARLKAGKPAMGFINPWLYQTHQTACTDVTEGGSTGCPSPGQPKIKGQPTIKYASWNASQGWDPVTGLGYPNFREMLKLI